MTTFEDSPDTPEREIGDEDDENPVLRVEKFPDLDYEESMRVFDEVIGEPNLDEVGLEEEVHEEFGDELEPENKDGMHKDEFFSVLSNNRRRTVLRYMDLRADEAPFELRELSEVVAAQENDKEVEELTSDERKRVYVALYQGHLPDIDELGLIEFDSDRGLIDFPEEGDEYVFKSMNALLEDEVCPEDQIVNEEYFDRVFAEEESEGYLSRLRQRLPF